MSSSRWEYNGEEDMTQTELFDQTANSVRLPVDFEPAAPRGFRVERIVLAKGAVTSEERRRFVSRIREALPAAVVEEQFDTPHNRIECGGADPLERSNEGKTTLVIGEHRSAVRLSDEDGNTCPNYRHFSPYGNCFYGCKYCYLSGTAGAWRSPSVKIFLNIDEMAREIDVAATARAEPTSFYVGKLQDGLALDSLTSYSTVFIPFFARHKFARQVILTKSGQVDRLPALEHNGNTIVSWSVNPPEVVADFEENTPSIDERIAAMRLCAEAGYPVRAVLMPVIPVADFVDVYSSFVRALLEAVPLQRLTIGGICMYRNARALMERRCGGENAISAAIEKGRRAADGRYRYPPELRERFYEQIISRARAVSPNLEVSLCLEEPEVWNAVAAKYSLGRCNCVL